MNWKKLLASPPPSAAWLLEANRLALVMRDRKGQLAGQSVGVDEGIFEVGAAGLHGVDDERLGAELDRMLEGRQRPKRAALVMPTGWFRSHLLSFDRLPNSKREVEEVVRWRLKKVLPVRPNEVRLAVVPGEAGATEQKVLCLVGIEKAITALEDVFTSRGMHLGQITASLFALANGSLTSDTGVNLVVQLEESFLSFLLLQEGSPRLVRMKPLPSEGLAWAAVERELRLIWSYVQQELGNSSEVRITIGCEDESTDIELRRWWRECEGARLDDAPSAWQYHDWYRALGSVRGAAVLAVLKPEMVK